MPAGRDYRPIDDPLIEKLFRRECAGLVKYAEIAFRKYGGYVDPRGRAEEIVQETFFLAAEKREELLEREDKQAYRPFFCIGWIYHWRAEIFYSHHSP